MRNMDWLKYIFRHEREIHDAVLEAKLGTNGHTGGGSSGHCHVSDPTPASAIRRAEEIGSVTLRDKSCVRWPERWLKVIELVRVWCRNDPIDEALFSWVLTMPKLKYGGTRLRREKMCEDLHIEKSMYYDRIFQICIYGDGVAEGMGLNSSRKFRE